MAHLIGFKLMTVEELIKELQKYDGTLEVVSYVGPDTRNFDNTYIKQSEEIILYKYGKPFILKVPTQVVIE